MNIRTKTTIIKLILLTMMACWTMTMLHSGSQIGLDPNGGHIGSPLTMGSMGDYGVMVVAIVTVFLIYKTGDNKAAEFVKDEK